MPLFPSEAGPVTATRIPFWPDLGERNRQPELMDDPALPPEDLRRALAGLAMANRASRAAAALWRPIRELTRTASLDRLSILDIASGGGDVAVGVARRAAGDGIAVDLLGLDINPHSVALARDRAAAAGVPVRFEQHDVLVDPLPDGFDVVTCSLFVHHLDEPEIHELLTRMRQAAGRLLLIDDLRRSRRGYLLAWAGPRLFSRCRIVQVDGPLSVAGAFTPAEALELAHRAGLDSATISCHWPQRWLLAAAPGKVAGCP